MVGIYRFVNLVNGKSYVGKSNNLRHRELEHMRFLRGGIEPCTKLNLAWQKYGESNFKYEILCYCREDQLDDLERLYIEKYDSLHNGYNCTSGGGGILGYHHTEDAKRKIGDASRGRAIPEWQRKMISDAQKGRPLTEEHKQALRDAWTPERRENMSKTRSGKNHPNYGKCGKDSCRGRAVICSTGELFYTGKDAAQWCGLKSPGNITTCCRGLRPYTGRHPITGAQLSWRYASDEDVLFYEQTQHTT